MRRNISRCAPVFFPQSNVSFLRAEIEVSHDGFAINRYAPSPCISTALGIQRSRNILLGWLSQVVANHPIECMQKPALHLNIWQYNLQSAPLEILRSHVTRYQKKRFNSGM